MGRLRGGGGFMEGMDFHEEHRWPPCFCDTGRDLLALACWQFCWSRYLLIFDACSTPVCGAMYKIGRGGRRQRTGRALARCSRNHSVDDSKLAQSRA